MLFIISISKKRQKKEIVPDKKKENKKKKKKINIMNTLGNNYLLKKRDLKDKIYRCVEFVLKFL